MPTGGAGKQSVELIRVVVLTGVIRTEKFPLRYRERRTNVKVLCGSVVTCEDIAYVK